MHTAARFIAGKEGTRDCWGNLGRDGEPYIEAETVTPQRTLAFWKNNTGTWEEVRSNEEIDAVLRQIVPGTIRLRISPSDSIRVPQACARCARTEADGKDHRVRQSRDWKSASGQSQSLGIDIRYCDACWSKTKWREYLPIALGVIGLPLGGAAVFALGVGAFALFTAVTGFIIIGIPALVLGVLLAALGAVYGFLGLHAVAKTLACPILGVSRQYEIHLAEADDHSAIIEIEQSTIARSLATLNLDLAADDGQAARKMKR